MTDFLARYGQWRMVAGAAKGIGSALALFGGNSRTYHGEYLPANKL